MPGNKKPKRKLPRGPGKIAANAHEIAFDRRRLMSVQHREDYKEHHEGAYKLMCSGGLDRDGWGILAGALNVAEQLTKLQIGANLLEFIMRGQEALLKIGQRLNEDGRVTCWGLEIGVIREALDYFNIQLSLCTNGELDRACNMAVKAARSPKTMRVVSQTSANTRPKEEAA